MSYKELESLPLTIFLKALLTLKEGIESNLEFDSRNKP